MPLFFAAQLNGDSDHAEPGWVMEVLDELALGGMREIRVQRFGGVILGVDGDARHVASRLATGRTGNAMAFAGYIYNLTEAFPEICSAMGVAADPAQTAEILLRAFEHKGIAAFERLNGHFAAAIWDAQAKALHVLRDALGVHPVFVHERQGVTLACSEFQPLLRGAMLSAALNSTAVAEFLLAGSVLGTKTFISGLDALSPGHVLTMSTAGSEERVFETFTIPEPDESASLDDLAEAVDVAFRAGVAMRLAHLGSSLSPINLTGGLDTRLILSSIPKDVRPALSYTTTRNIHLSKTDDLEVIYAAMVAAAFEVQHEVIAPQHDLEVGEFSTEAFEATRRIPSATACNFHGVYGTELLGGCFRSGFEGVFGGCTPGSIEETLAKRCKPEFVASLEGLEDLTAFVKAQQAGLGIPDILSALLGSFFTTLYGGMLQGWTVPWEKFLLSEHYPFLDRGFLAALMRVPARHLENYELYARLLLNHHREAIALPFHSGACRHPGLMIVRPTFADPKSKALRYATYADHIRLQKSKGHSAFVDSVMSDEAALGFLRNKGESLTENAQLNLLDLEAWVERYGLGRNQPQRSFV